jgi:hypothetical protein
MLILPAGDDWSLGFGPPTRTCMLSWISSRLGYVPGLAGIQMSLLKGPNSETEPKMYLIWLRIV